MVRSDMSSSRLTGIGRPPPCWPDAGGRSSSKLKASDPSRTSFLCFSQIVLIL
jgi:hypothetical protein